MKKVKLTTICIPKQWKTIPVTDLQSEGYPVYGANGIIGYYGEYNHEKSVIAITCRGATCGTINMTVPKAYITGNAMCLDNLRSDIDLKYLYYNLLHYNFTPIISGTAQPQITRQSLEHVELSISTPQQQKQIVQVLDQVAAIKAARQKQLDALDELVKARFIEMFGHQSHNEKKMKSGKVDDVAEIYLGLTHTPMYTTAGVTFISAKNTSCDYLDLTDVKYVSREEFERAPVGAKPKINDVLFSRVGSNLGHPVILKEDKELCTFVSLGFLRTKGNVTSNYLKHWMRDDFFSTQVKERVRGGGQPNLNTGWLKEFKIIIPSLSLQKAFDFFCEQVEQTKTKIRASLAETETLFQSLMQEYFG